MKTSIDIAFIKKELEEFAEDPMLKLEYYAEEFKFAALKLVQGLVEDLDYNLTMELDKEYMKREPVIFTPDEDLVIEPEDKEV